MVPLFCLSGKYSTGCSLYGLLLLSFHEQMGPPPQKSTKKLPKAASSLTCIEGNCLEQKPNCDFAYYNIETIKHKHEKKSEYLLKNLLNFRVQATILRFWHASHKLQDVLEG